MREIITLTLIVNISSTILGMVIGTFIGYRLYLSKSKIKGLFLGINRTMMGLPPVVLGLVLFLLLRTNGALGFLGFLFQPQSLVLAQTILIIPIVAGNVYNLLVSKGSILFFTLDMYDLSIWKKIIYSLKDFRNELLFILILAFSRAVSEVGAVMVVGGNIGGRTRIMTTALATLRSMGDTDTALVYGAILLGITFIIQFLLNLFNKEAYNHENF